MPLREFRQLRRSHRHNRNHKVISRAQRVARLLPVGGLPESPCKNEARAHLAPLTLAGVVGDLNARQVLPLLGYFLDALPVFRETCERVIGQRTLKHRPNDVWLGSNVMRASHCSLDDIIR